MTKAVGSTLKLGGRPRLSSYYSMPRANLNKSKFFMTSTTAQCPFMGIFAQKLFFMFFILKVQFRGHFWPPTLSALDCL